MTTAAKNVWTAYQKLTPEEKHEVAAQILRVATDSDGVPDAALDELADDVFAAYDAEEAGRAVP